MVLHKGIGGGQSRPRHGIWGIRHKGDMQGYARCTSMAHARWARHGFRQPPSVALAPFRGSALVAFSFLFFWRYGDGERRKEKAYRKKNKKYRQNQKRLLHLPNSMTSPCTGVQRSLARTPARLGPGTHPLLRLSTAWWAGHGFRQLPLPSEAWAPFCGCAFVASSFIFPWRYGDGEEQKREPKGRRINNIGGTENNFSISQTPQALCGKNLRPGDRPGLKILPHPPWGFPWYKLGKAWLLAAAFYDRGSLFRHRVGGVLISCLWRPGEGERRKYDA